MISSRKAYRVNAVLAAGHFCAVALVLGVLVDNDGGWSVPVVLHYNNWTRVEANDSAARFAISTIQ